MTKNLIIPDVHQELAWVNAVLAREPVERPEDVVFLGDYLDKQVASRRPSEIDETCRAVRAWAEAGHTLLPGNHDAQYLERLLNPEGRRMLIGSSPLDPAPFSKHFPDAAAVNATFRRLHRTLPLGYAGRSVLLTHAGLHAAHVPRGYDEGDLDRLLDIAWSRTVESDWREPHPIVYMVGQCRGGTRFTHTGGVLWRDHDQEGTSLLADQICGHTVNFDGINIQRVVNPAGEVRHHVCLDGRQSTYGVLEGCRLTVRACTTEGAPSLFSAQLSCGFLECLRELTLDFLSGAIIATAGRFDAPPGTVSLNG